MAVKIDIIMPKNCLSCPCFGFLTDESKNEKKQYAFCQLLKEYRLNKSGKSKPEDCPLKEDE